MSGSPATPATGTIVFDYAYATIEFECTDTGSDTNIDGGGSLTIQTSISGADDDITIGPEGFTGGDSEESDDDARTRLLLARSSRAGVFTEDQINKISLSNIIRDGDISWLASSILGEKDLEKVMHNQVYIETILGEPSLRSLSDDSMIPKITAALRRIIDNPKDVAKAIVQEAKYWENKLK